MRSLCQYSQPLVTERARFGDVFEGQLRRTRGRAGASRRAGFVRRRCRSPSRGPDPLHSQGILERRPRFGTEMLIVAL